MMGNVIEGESAVDTNLRIVGTAATVATPDSVAPDGPKTAPTRRKSLDLPPRTAHHHHHHHCRRLFKSLECLYGQRGFESLVGFDRQSTSPPSEPEKVASLAADAEQSRGLHCWGQSSDSTDSYWTAIESPRIEAFLSSPTTEGVKSDSNGLPFPQAGAVDAEAERGPSDLDKGNRRLLGRAFSCDGAGLRANMDEDSDENESDRGRSIVRLESNASMVDVDRTPESDDDRKDKTLAAESNAAEVGDGDGDDRKRDDSVPSSRGSSTNDLDLKSFDVDPSSAASEQVLESLTSSSSQPNFDDPTEQTSEVFVFPGGNAASQTTEATSTADATNVCDDADDDDDFLDKMPKSPLVRTGSRIIDKSTKTVRGRPKSYHPSTSLQSEIKEEIFTEMGFARDQQAHDPSRERIRFADPVVVMPKPRIPFKSIQVQSLVEMDEEEAEERGTLERNKTGLSRSCRPKSFPSIGFLEEANYINSTSDSESNKQTTDASGDTSDMRFGRGLQSQSPPPRSLTATPSLTTSSALIQPCPTQKNISTPQINHFEACRNDNSKKAEDHGLPEKFKVVLRKDPQGYGIRTGGNKPVSILSVAEGSVAARSGLKARDVILMLNGTNVSQYDHESVTNFFKASRTHMEIVVLRQADNRSDPSKTTNNQIEYLKCYPALLACFLLDLTIQNKQNSLFFSLAVYLLRQKDSGDSNFQRWAYEIFSTFLDQHAPLKLQHSLEVPSITGLLESDEASIRQSYDSVDGFLQTTIKKQLNDHLKNNGMVHEFELRKMDHSKQMKHIEKILWKTFETLSSEEKDDKKQALAASMATFFHLVGFSSIRGGNLLETFPSFVSKKMPVKMKKNKGHVFKSECMTNLMPCGVCKHPTWNLGTTVYKCSSCSFYVHSYCLFKLTEACNFKRKTNSFVPFYGVDDPSSSFNLTRNYAGLFRSRSCQLSSKSSFVGDPDLDIPHDLPNLKDVIPLEELKKLKSKELKFQEIINELFHTERLHLRNLKVLKMLYEQPMRAEVCLSTLTNLLFPNLDDLIRIHDGINSEFEKCREDQAVVTKIGDLLISLLSGIRGDQLKRASSIFCKDQSYALLILRKNMRNEKLAQVIQEGALNPYSLRLGLKDFLPKEMQRITKYPLLIDGLVNSTAASTEEHAKLQEASKLSREILRYVDGQVRDCENGRRLMDFQLRLDSRLLENSTDPNVVPYRKLNLTKKKLILDGELVWKYKRAGGSKSQTLHVVLCEDVLLLLIKQEGRMVLKCHTTTIEDHIYVYYPVLELSGLLAKDAGRDKCAFFIVDSNFPQVYHMVAKNKEARNRWYKAITDAANQARLRVINKAEHQKVIASSSSVSFSSSSSSSSSSSANREHDNESTEMCGHRRNSAPPMLGSYGKGASKRKLPELPSGNFDVKSPPGQERRIPRPCHLDLSSLSSPSPSSSSSLHGTKARVIDNLRRNILIVNDLLHEKISILKDISTPDQSYHHRHHPRGHHPQTSLISSSCDSGKSIDAVFSVQSKNSDDDGFFSDCIDEADDNGKLLSCLATMSDREVVSFCLPQIEAIQRLIDDQLDISDTSATDLSTTGESRHLQQLHHWRIQGLRLKNLNLEADQPSLCKIVNNAKHLSGESFSSVHSYDNDNNNNSNSLVDSAINQVSSLTCVSNPVQPSAEGVLATHLHRNALTLRRLVTFKTRIELALSQLMVCTHEHFIATGQKLEEE